MARAEDARELVERLLRQVTQVPGGDEALALPQGYFGAQHSCLFPSILSVSLAGGRANARRSASQQRADRRALVTALTQLSRSPGFDFCAFYDGFWRDRVLQPVAALNPDGRSYVSLNRCVTFTDELHFMLTLPQSVKKQHFGQLLEFLRTPDRDVLSQQDRQVLGSQRQARSGIVTATFILDVSSAVLLPSTIQGLADVFKKYADTPEEQLKQCAVQFTPVMLWFDQCRISDPTLWSALASLFESSSSPVPALVLFYSRIKSDRHHLLGFRQFIHRSVGSPAVSSLRSLNLLGTQIKRDQVISIFSALWYASNLEELCLEHFCEANCSDQMLWLWIALGAFHPDSKSKLRHLNLTHFHVDGPGLTLRDSLLLSPAPGKCLHDKQRVPRNGCGELPDDRRELMRFQVGAEVRGTANSRSAVLFEICDSDREYEVSYLNARHVCVLVPGYGLGWLRSTSVVSQRDIPSQVTPQNDPDTAPMLPRRQLQSFTYRDIATAGNVIATVRLLGDELEALDLENSEINGNELAQILRLFPRLATLNIRAPADAGLQPLLEYCRESTEGGKTRSTLVTIEVSVQSSEEVRQLVQLLSEASGRSIGRIHLYVKQSEAMQALGELARVLAHNRSLAYLGIFTRFDEGVWSLFRDFHGQVLRLMFPLTHKLALLSVLSDPTSRGRPVRSLDAGVLSIIFQFASVPVKREVHIFDEYD
jgi:hypothetical protein